MKKTLLILLLFLCNFLNAQQFDNKIDNFRTQIIQSFKEYGEISNKKEVDSLQFKYLYSRRLAKVNSKIIYYEIGRMTNHGYKFLAIYNDGKLTVLPSKNFNDEFTKIITPLENIKRRKTDCFNLLKSIQKIYNYNNNPPWMLNLELKN
jgi:hypothetical protein